MQENKFVYLEARCRHDFLEIKREYEINKNFILTKKPCFAAINKSIF